MLSKAAGYSAIEHLRDGRQIEVRAFRPEDPSALIAAVGQVGPRSRYLRFFTLKRKFSDREREFFLNVDFDEHVACQKPIIAAGRYDCVAPGKAEGRIHCGRPASGSTCRFPRSPGCWATGGAARSITRSSGGPARRPARCEPLATPTRDRPANQPTASASAASSCPGGNGFFK